MQAYAGAAQSSQVDIELRLPTPQRGAPCRRDYPHLAASPPRVAAPLRDAPDTAALPRHQGPLRDACAQHAPISGWRHDPHCVQPPPHSSWLLQLVVRGVLMPRANRQASAWQPRQGACLLPPSRASSSTQTAGLSHGPSAINGRWSVQHHRCAGSRPTCRRWAANPQLRCARRPRARHALCASPVFH